MKISAIRNIEIVIVSLNIFDLKQAKFILTKL